MLVPLKDLRTTTGGIFTWPYLGRLGAGLGGVVLGIMAFCLALEDAELVGASFSIDFFCFFFEATIVKPA